MGGQSTHNSPTLSELMARVIEGGAEPFRSQPDTPGIPELRIELRNLLGPVDAEAVIHIVTRMGWRGQAFGSLMHLRLDLMKRGIRPGCGQDGASKAAIAEIDRLRSETTR